MTEDQKATLTRLAMILEAGQAANGIDHARQEIYAEALRALLSASIADTAGAPQKVGHIATNGVAELTVFDLPTGTNLYIADTAGAKAVDAWPSAEDAAIKACAFMIKGICMTKPQDQWTALIEKRIRFMLKESK